MSMPYIQASKTKRAQAITDIIESIALEECALSHILNAEGETLQKVLCFHDLTMDEIIKMNNSMTAVIKGVADVEKKLQEKLKLFKHCLCRSYEVDDDDCDEDDEDDFDEDDFDEDDFDDDDFDDDDCEDDDCEDDDEDDFDEDDDDVCD